MADFDVMWAEAIGELAAERTTHKFQVERLKEEIEIHKGVAKALMDQLEALEERLALNNEPKF